VPVEKEYRFETEDGTKSLADLFDGSSHRKWTVNSVGCPTSITFG
jgi:hypothetical protein